MPKAGFLIAGAAVIVAVAIGFFFWGGWLKELGTGGQPVSNAPGAEVSLSGEPDQKVVELAEMLSEVKNAGGFTATFSSADVPKWKLAAGHRLERLELVGQDQMLARLSGSERVDPSVVMDGLLLELPVEFSQRANGKKIEIGIVARASKVGPADSFLAIYLTRQAGNSGWRQFKLSPELVAHKFEYDVPAVSEGYQQHPIVAIHADPGGGDRGVELLGAYVRILE